MKRHTYFVIDFILVFGLILERFSEVFGEQNYLKIEPHRGIEAKGPRAAK